MNAEDVQTSLCDIGCSAVSAIANAAPRGHVTCVPKGVTCPVECPDRCEEAMGYLLGLQNISAPGSLSQ